MAQAMQQTPTQHERLKISREELVGHAIEGSKRLRTYKVATVEVYLVKSRKTEPGSYWEVEVRGEEIWCSCPASKYFGVCAHAFAVERRLKRRSRRVASEALRLAA